MIDFILENATEEELGLAVEENLFALFRAMSTLPDSQAEETEYLSRHLAFPTNPMYKGVWNTRLAPQGVDQAINETIDWFKSRSAPFFFCWTGPKSQPEDIGLHLTRHGFIDMEGQGHSMTPGIKSTAIGAPGMVADLHNMNEILLTKVSQEFAMNDVQNETDLQDFKRVFIEGYDMPPVMAEGWVQSTHEFGIGKTPWRLVGSPQWSAGGDEYHFEWCGRGGRLWNRRYPICPWQGDRRGNYTQAYARCTR